MNFKNSKKQGDFGLGMAIAHFVSEGKTVSIPLTDSQEYDIIVDFDGCLKKIQVKTASYKRNGFYEVTIKTCGGNKSNHIIKKFDGGMVDYMFIITVSGEKYLIPTNNDFPCHSLKLGKRYDSFKL